MFKKRWQKHYITVNQKLEVLFVHPGRWSISIEYYESIACKKL